MFYIESEVSQLKSRVEPGNIVKINNIDMAMVGFDADSKTVSFKFMHRNMEISCQYVNIMGDKWVNGNYSLSLGLVIENDLLYKLPVYTIIKEIPIGQTFPIRYMTTNGKPSRHAIRFIGFVVGFKCLQGLFSYSSFASNAMADAMMFVGPDGRVYVYDQYGNWYRHGVDGMQPANIKCIEKLKYTFPF